MLVINPKFFDLHPAKILEEVKNALDKEPLSEEIKNLLIDDVRKKLAYGTDLRPGVGFTASPSIFLEEAFWTVVTEGEKVLRIKVSPTGGSQFYFEVLEELPAPPEVEEKPDMTEILKELLPGVIFSWVRLDRLLKEIRAAAVRWDNPKTLALLAETLTPGTYIIHLSKEGIEFYSEEPDEGKGE